MSENQEHIEQFFAYEHLPPKLQAVSKPFCVLARIILGTDHVGQDAANAIDPNDGGPPIPIYAFPLPWNPERTVALRKLLEAKDAAVRAVIAKR